MRRSFAWLVLSLALAAAVLAGCGGESSAPQAVENYLEALVAGDADRLVNLSCAEWETDARVEADAFDAVAPTLNDVSCQAAGTDGDYTLVSCTGAILATYNDERRELPLEDRTFRALFEGGEWRMCGYQE
jgi:hypothetical protein